MRRIEYKILFNHLNHRLPSTYPKPLLVIHNTIKDLNRSYYRNNTDKDFDNPPCAYCDPEDNTVHVAIPYLKKQDKIGIVSDYLHEIGHLYVYSKYGAEDERWKSEKRAEQYAENFAYRWIKRLSDEEILKC
jgi:hypothetical protein